VVRAWVFVALVGATLILVRGRVFARVRPLWPSLFGCAQCVGFWVGGTAGGMGLAPLVGRGRALDALLVGCGVSLLALLTDAVLLKLLGDPHESMAPRDGRGGDGP
jgi:hypothetical protein